MATHCHNTPGLPGETLMPMTERTLIAEKLRLALDEIETGARDLRSIREAVRYQREAIRASHRRLERLGSAA